MVGLILYYLGCYGVTMFIVQSLLMKPIRALIMKKSFILGELISCMTCTGFWVMLVISFLMPTYVPTETYLPLHGVAAKIMNSLTGMTIITFVYIFILVIETHFKIDW